MESGTGTKFDVLEASTQLSKDRQLLSEKKGNKKMNEIKELEQNIYETISEIEVTLSKFNSGNVDLSIRENLDSNEISKLEKDWNIVCESGISSLEDLRYLIDNNFKTFLIGEFLMKSEKPDILINNILKYKLKK